VWSLIIEFIDGPTRKYGSSPILKASLVFLSRTSKLLRAVCQKVIATQRVQIRFKMYQTKVPAYLALHGFVQAVKYVRETGCAWNSKTCSNAALNGHLDVLKYARSEHCYWKAVTCSNAALNGHLSVLQWATENGCKKNHLVTTNAAKNGHLGSVLSS